MQQNPPPPSRGSTFSHSSWLQSHSKASVELQSVRTEPDPAVRLRAALIPLLDQFPETKAAPAGFWFQDVLLQTHVLLLFPQAAGRRSEGLRPGRLRWSRSASGRGCGSAQRNAGNSIPAGTSASNKASILPAHTPEPRQHLQAPPSSAADPLPEVLAPPQRRHVLALLLSPSTCLHPPFVNKGCRLSQQVRFALMLPPSPPPRWGSEPEAEPPLVPGCGGLRRGWSPPLTRFTCTQAVRTVGPHIQHRG